MHRLVPLAVVLTTCFSPQARAADLWEAALNVARLGHQAQAERQLRDAGREGVGILLRMARLGRQRIMLDRAAFRVGCISLLNMHVPMFQDADIRGNGSATGPAAELAGQLLAERPEWAEALIGSQVALERQMALVALTKHPEHLVKTLEALLEGPQDPGLVHPAMLVSWCFKGIRGKGDSDLPGRIVEAAEALGTASTPVIADEDCAGPDFVDSELVKDLASGETRFHSGSSRYGPIRHRLQHKNGDAVGLSAGCLISAYQAVRERRGPDRSLAGLLVGLARDMRLPAEQRARAAEVVSADLETFDPFHQQPMAADLVNAGFDVPVEVVYDATDKLPRANIHEAAIRQGDPSARAAVLSTVVCPGWSHDEVALLGFSDQPAAADQAADIALHCPGSQAAATAALIRLGDSRARGLLFSMLVSRWHFGPGDDELIKALKERGGPDLLELIDSMAKAGNRGARRLQMRLDREAAGGQGR